MKHSKDYYHNRKRIKELCNETGRFRPEVSDVNEWFDILNEQIFGNKLIIFDDIHIKRHKGFHALFHYFPRKENKPTGLSMNKCFDDKKMFVEILAHEMIHLFQYHYNEPLGHGPSFWVWNDIFKLKGLELNKVI